MNRESSADNKGKDPRIFVAGIPCGLTFREVENYFSTFGKITSISEIKKSGGKKANASKSSSSEETVKSGSCCLIVGDQETKKAILNCHNHSLKGRQIMCQQFKNGKTLRKTNQECSSKRALAKRVPSVFSESLVKETLEAAYGPINIIFPLIPEIKKRGVYHSFESRDYRTYSVMFKHTSSMDRLAKQPQINIQGVACNVEPFNRNYKVDKKHDNNSQKKSKEPPMPSTVSIPAPEIKTLFGVPQSWEGRMEGHQSRPYSTASGSHVRAHSYVPHHQYNFGVADGCLSMTTTQYNVETQSASHSMVCLCSDSSNCEDCLRRSRPSRGYSLDLKYKRPQREGPFALKQRLIAISMRACRPVTRSLKLQDREDAH